MDQASTRWAAIAALVLAGVAAAPHPQAQAQAQLGDSDRVGCALTIVFHRSL
jgi:hypothetical protein